MADIRKVRENLYEVQPTNITEYAPVAFYCTAQDLRDLEAYATLHMRELEQEADEHAKDAQASLFISPELRTTLEEATPGPDWRAIERRAQADLEAIQTDQDAYRFIENYLSKELRSQLVKIYQSDRHEMNRSPQQSVKNLLSLPPL